jgi:hypothetical protein
MENRNLNELFIHYENLRHTHLSQEHFKYLVLLFPSLKVCMSDGVLDAEEWNALLKTAKAMAEAFALSADEKSDLLRIINQELIYLLDHIENWDQPFMSALWGHLQANPQDKEYVEESIFLFANVADGISHNESVVIGEITEKLALHS